MSQIEQTYSTELTSRLIVLNQDLENCLVESPSLAAAFKQIIGRIVLIAFIEGQQSHIKRPDSDIRFNEDAFLKQQI